jgi:hypothetical protein
VPVGNTASPWKGVCKELQVMAHGQFRDSAGRTWDVWDVVPSAGERRARLTLAAETAWLCFETENEKRRLVDYPANWHELLDPELEALCRTGIEARVRPRRLVE